MAALLIRTSSFPWRSATQRAAAATLAGSVTSSRRGSAPTARAALEAAAAERAVSTTAWPRSASWRQISRPMPRLPPVTSETVLISSWSFPVLVVLSRARSRQIAQRRLSGG
jgi:hypothetical protein